MKKIGLCLALISLGAIAACHKSDGKAAVEAAIQQHLNQNQHLMLNSFSTHFEQVSIKGDTAVAVVKYDSKKVSNLAVEVSYGLKRSNGVWEVVSSSPVGGQVTNPANPHQGPALDQAPAPGGSPAPVPSH